MLIMGEYSVLHKTAICSVLVLLCFDYWNAITPVIHMVRPPFRIRQPYYSKHGSAPVIPHNSSLIGLDRFQYINSAPSCDPEEPPLVLAIISSHPDHAEKRQFIRQSWGREYFHWRTVFLVGIPTPDIAPRLNKEIELYGDIVQGNFKDAYRNMTYKHVMGLRWALENCNRARYLLKADDDIVCNPHLAVWLARALGPWGVQGLITCQAFLSTKPARSSFSKWQVTEQEWPESTYPPYCAGWAVIYDGKVAQRLLIRAQESQFFWIDDVLITGVLAKQESITPTNFGPLLVDNNICNSRTSPKVALFAPPNLSIQQMKDYWHMWQ